MPVREIDFTRAEKRVLGALMAAYPALDGMSPAFQVAAIEEHRRTDKRGMYGHLYGSARHNPKDFMHAYTMGAVLPTACDVPIMAAITQTGGI